MTIFKFAIFCFIMIPFATRSQMPNHRIYLFEGKLELTIPDSLYQIGDTDTAKSKNTPRSGHRIFFSSIKTGVQLDINDLEQAPIKGEKIAKTMDNVIAALQTKISDTRIIERRETIISGKKGYFFKASLPFFGRPEPEFDYMTMTVRNGHMLTFAFTCGMSSIPIWGKEFDAIMESVRIE